MKGRGSKANTRRSENWVYRGDNLIDAFEARCVRTYEATGFLLRSFVSEAPFAAPVGRQQPITTRELEERVWVVNASVAGSIGSHEGY